MPLFSESVDTIYGSIISELSNNTNLTRFSKGSLVRELGLAVANKLGKMWGQFDINVAQAFINGAQGKYLSYLGDMLGVQRLGEETATINVQTRNIRFYTNTGTFGTINGGSAISMPAGKIISTGPSATGTQYRLTSAVVLGAASSEQYVAAEAVVPGAASNVGRAQLVYHDFINYSQVNDNTLLVTNEADIVSGKDGESDTNYRYRIANQVFATQYANETAVRLAALAVPGVADLIILRHYKGIGTFELLIKSTVPEISDTLVANVSAAVAEVTAMGELGSVRGPLESGISLTGTIRLKRRLTAQEETDLINATTNNTIDYINSLDIGEELIINEIVEKVLSTSESVKNIGTTSQPFDSLYLYKQSVVDGGKARQTLVDDYTPEEDERIIVETVHAGNVPILYRTTL